MTSHKGGGNRQFGSSQGKRLTSQSLVNTIHFVQNLARLDFSNPVFRVTLTVTHTNFGRLLGNRLVRENTDPDTATPFDVAGHGTTGCLDLTCSQTATAS